MPLAESSTIGALVSAVITSATSLCHKPDYIHLVLDSYYQLSIKKREHMRRADMVAIDIIDINADTPIPRQLEKFWASEKSRQNMELLVRDVIFLSSFLI